MSEKREPVLVLCDREEEYVSLMTEFLGAQSELPLKVHTYTDPGRLLEEEKDCTIDVLVVAERTFDESLDRLHPLRTIVLNESGYMRFENYLNVDKYQQAQNVLKAILEAYLEVAEIVLPRFVHEGKTKFIGLYSPVRRCFQTSIALTMSRMLSEKHRTLYLNFEHYCGVSEIAAQTGARDLADLMYFLMADEQKFRLRLQTIVQHIGALDYVPPMKAGQNLIDISGRDWMSLIRKISGLNEYDYVIMDLSESMQGLFDILRNCRYVYTLTRKDRIAQTKLEEYDRILKEYAYGDIAEKTMRYEAPNIKRFPEELERYTKGELAFLAERMIQEMEDSA